MGRVRWNFFEILSELGTFTRQCCQLARLDSFYFDKQYIERIIMNEACVTASRLYSPRGEANDRGSWFISLWAEGIWIDSCLC